MTQRVLASRVIHTDDTTVPIQSPGAKQCRKGAFGATWETSQSVHGLRLHAEPEARRPGTMARRVSGYLQADAYGGYDCIYHAHGVTEVACGACAAEVLRRAGLGQRGLHRCLPLSASCTPWSAKRKRPKMMRGSDTSGAERAGARTHQGMARRRRGSGAPAQPHCRSDYVRREPVAVLTTYTNQGFLNIDNNASERGLKRVAIGRKNWLFAGNDAAAENHARLWSLIASAERHGLDPQRYLTSILAKIVQTSARVLPQFLRPSHADGPLAPAT